MTSLLKSVLPQPREEGGSGNFPHTQAKVDSSRPTMMALTWQGAKRVSLEESPSVDLTDPGDAIVRVTHTTVCGSDLHLYHNELGGMSRGMSLGHEAIGVVDKVGPNVSTVRVGQRVIISAVISCGDCDWCKRKEFSCCFNTNPSQEMDASYGGRCAALFGYSKLTGAYPGLQAEFARVPFADVNLLPIPDSVAPETAILLSDVACTAWHGNECAEVGRGDRVAIWGGGPIGQVAAMWAKYRGASHVYLIDNVPYRLEMAAANTGAIPINFDQVDPVKELKKLCLPAGPDCAIDCAGFRFTSNNAAGMLARAERAIGVQTDAPNILNEMIHAVRTAGRIALIGDYAGYANHVHIGAFMEKSLRMRGGQLWAQKYWRDLLSIMRGGGEFTDPSFIFTHRVPLAEIERVYTMMDGHTDGCVKALISTRFAGDFEAAPASGSRKKH